MQVHGAEYAEIHGNLSDGWSTEIRDEELHYMAMPIQDEPFEIHFKNGIVIKFAFC